MVIRLKRYYGDHAVTKSVMEVWMDGELEPRMVCEARECSYVEYTETFPGASRCCLPVGRWRMKVGQSPYGVMGLRVPKCPGHRQVFVGHRWSRQCFEGEVLIGESTDNGQQTTDGGEQTTDNGQQTTDGRIVNGDVVYARLERLVYEAYGKGEEFWMEVIADNGLLTTDNGRRTTDNGQRTTDGGNLRIDQPTRCQPTRWAMFR